MSERDCKATDGLFSKKSSECKHCYVHHRQICQVFALYKGLREIEYFVDYDEVESENKFTDISTLVDRLRKSKGSI